MDEIIDALIVLLNTGLAPRGITAYYGDPKHLPLDKLPAIGVKPSETEDDIIGTGNLRRERFYIDIKLYVSLRDKLKQDTTDISYMRTLVRTFEQRIEGSRRPRTDTILGILEANLSLSGTCDIIKPAGNINYIDQEDAREGTAYLRLMAERTP